MLKISLIIAVTLRVLFYNCENLLFSSGHVYEKLINLTRVIVGAGEGVPPAIIGLAEVENDSIMERWTKRTPLARWNYKYIITHSNDVRGINVALMYQPDDFRLLGSESIRVDLPKDMRPTRDILHAWGRIINSDTLDVIVVHLPSRYGGKKATDKAREISHQKLRTLMDSVSRVRYNPHLLVMGDFNELPDSKTVVRDFSDYTNLTYTLQKELERGRLLSGTHKYQGEWGFLDQMIVNNEMTDSLASVSTSVAWPFSLPFMMTTDVNRLGVRPKRSRYGYKYEGGYSDHLPICVDVNIRKQK